MDELVKVIFHPLNRVIWVKKDSSVLDAIRQADILFESICGGRGECRKCKVIHTRGSCTAGSKESIRGLIPDEIRLNYCLACMTYLLGDCEFIIPVESRIDAPKILRGECTGTVSPTPAVNKFRTITENGSSFITGHRSVRLEGYTGERPRMSSEQSRQISSAACTCTVTISHTGGYPEVIAVEQGDTTRRNYGLALDLGTTTVVGMLVNLADMNFCSQASTLNRQITYGEELVSRLAYARDPGGLEALRTAAVDSINSVISRLTEGTGIEPRLINDICLSGNTVMQYLLLGKNTAGLEMVDAPVDRSPFIVKAGEIGLMANLEAYVYFLPNVSRYVGGDAIGDILVSGMHVSEGLSLLVDLGTNGEIILGNSDWLAAVSCASGPAFEGAGIRCGMRAMNGAVEHVSIDPVTCHATYSTINNQLPRGICGSGIIDAASAMAGAGILDFTGKLVDGRAGVRVGADGPEYVLVLENETATGRAIVITAADMAYVMDSKAAACGAVGVLMKKYRVRTQDIAHLYLAGAFGAFSNLQSIVAFGILPRFSHAHNHALGNGALGGATATLLFGQKRKEAEQIARKMVYIDLLVDSDFIEEYTSALYIPGKKEYFSD